MTVGVVAELQGGVYLNGHKLKTPEQELSLQDNDTLQVGRRTWFRNRIAEPPTLETGRLSIRPVRIRDIRDIARHVPEGDAGKYIVRFRILMKKTDMDIHDAF